MSQMDMEEKKQESESIETEPAAEEKEPETVEEAEAKVEAEESEGGTLDKVWKAIRAFRREDVADLIKNHALDIAGEDELEEIAAAIVELRDIKLVELLAKEMKTFTPDMLRLDFENWNNREFIRQVLSRCRKNFDLTDDKVCEELFEISCEIGQTEVLSYLVSKKETKEYYPMLAGGTEEAFRVLRQVKRSDLDADLRVEIMYEAAIAGDGQERLEKLSALGYDLDEKNSDDKMLSDLLNERIASGSYTKNRNGDLNRMKDKALVQYLEKKRSHQFDKKEKKKFSFKKALPFIILGVIFLAVLAYAIGYQIFS